MRPSSITFGLLVLAWLLPSVLPAATIRWFDEGKLLVRKRFVGERCIEQESFGKARVAILAFVADTERAEAAGRPRTVWIDSSTAKTRLEIKGMETRSRSWFKKAGRVLPSPAEGKALYLWMVKPDHLLRVVVLPGQDRVETRFDRKSLSFLPAVVHVENQNGRPPRRSLWIERKDRRIKLLLRSGKVAGTWVYPKQPPAGAAPSPGTRPAAVVERPALRPAAVVERPVAAPRSTAPRTAPPRRVPHLRSSRSRVARRPRPTAPPARPLRRNLPAFADGGRLAVGPEQAEGLLASGDGAGAVALYRRLLGARGKDPELWAGLGSAFLSLGNLSKAGNAYRLALKFHPSHRGALEGLGIIRAWTGDTAGALECLESALAGGASARAYRMCAWLYLGLGRWDEAAHAAENALSILPEEPEACFHLARAEEALGRFDRAQSFYRKAAAAEPSRSLGIPPAFFRPLPASPALRRLRPLPPSLHAPTEQGGSASASLPFWGNFGLGCLLWEATDTLSALEAFDHALNYWPDHEATLLNRARCLLDAGQIMAAVDAYRAMLARNKASEGARKGLDAARKRLLVASPPAPPAPEKEQGAGLDALFESVKAQMRLDEDDEPADEEEALHLPPPSTLTGNETASRTRRPARPPKEGLLRGLTLRRYHAPFSDEDYDLRSLEGNALKRFPRLVKTRSWDLDPQVEIPERMEGDGPQSFQLQLQGWLRPSPKYPIRITASLERVGSAGATVETDARIPAGHKAQQPVALSLKARLPAFANGTARFEVLVVEEQDSGNERILLRRAYGLRYEEGSS